MTYTSCISHPSRNTCLKIHEWQILACDGDVHAAALLSHFEGLHNHKYGIDQHHKHDNDIAELHSKPRVLNEDVLIPVKLADLRKSLFGLAAEKKISECLDRLSSKDFISIHNNPDPEKKLDRTKYVRFYPEMVNAWIRENYNNDGSLINPSCGQVADSAKKETRFGEKGDSILPKGGIDSAKKENAYCQKAESDKKRYSNSKGCRQVVDFSDNAKKETRFGEKGECIPPKGVLYNKINQSISINYNQDKYFVQSQEEKKITTSDHHSAAEVVNILIQLGLPSEKLNYPDAVPEIERLRQAGSTLEMFSMAYEISNHATKGNFGVRYLVKVVEGLLVKSQKKSGNKKLFFGRKEKNRGESLSQSQAYAYENDLKNAESWAADLLG